MKRLLSLVLAVVIVLFMATVVVAEGDIKVTIDGVPQTYDVMPVLNNDHTLLPMRGIFEALGAKISWEESTGTVTGVKGDITVVLQIGNAIAKVNGTEVALDVPTKLINDRTMVPARFISESLGCTVDWNDTTRTVVISSPTETEKNVGREMLDGKKAIFIGDSNVYWGKTVQGIEKTATQSQRENDTGLFYQICKANGVDVSVTNWTFGSHGLYNIFGGNPCTVKGCDSVVHEDNLTDRYYDYVIIGMTRGAVGEKHMLADFEYITNFFREVNPDVKFVCLCPAMVYGVNDTGAIRQNTINNLKVVEEKNDVIIADWGRLVKYIIDEKITVPGATQKYDKYSFVVTKDNRHPNMLAGYISALTAYCALTGESAVGQPYEFCLDETSSFSFSNYISSNYAGNADLTTFDEIFLSESDMKGLQRLIDEHLSEKSYRQERIF